MTLRLRFAFKFPESIALCVTFPGVPKLWNWPYDRPRAVIVSFREVCHSQPVAHQNTGFGKNLD